METNTRTEEDAAKSWCPLVGATSDARHAALSGKPPALPAPAVCVGSRCMAWIWAEPVFEVLRRAPIPADGEGWQESFQETGAWNGHGERVWKRRRAGRRGSCGMVPAAAGVKS